MKHNQEITSGYIATRFQNHKPVLIDDQTAPKRAGVAALVRSDAAGVSFFFIKRAIRDGDPWSGHMAFPGGRMEPESDPSIRAAVEREVYEEVGIELTSAAEFIGQADDIRAVGRGRIMPMAISVYLFEMRESFIPRSNDEVDEWIWIPITELLDPQHIVMKTYTVEELTIDMPTILYNGYLIWGLTLRMLANIFTILDVHFPAGDFQLAPSALFRENK